MLATFCAGYFQQADPDDVVPQTAEDLYGMLTREVFALGPTWQAIEALDNKVADQTQAEMLMELGRRTVRAATWFLRSRSLIEPMEQTIARLTPAVRQFLDHLRGTGPASWRAPIVEMQARFTQRGVPESLAFEVAAATTSLAALDLAEVAETARRPLIEVADTYFRIGDTLGLARLRAQVAALPSDAYWQALAKAASSDDLASLQRQLTADALQAGGLEPWQHDCVRERPDGSSDGPCHRCRRCDIYDGMRALRSIARTLRSTARVARTATDVAH